MNRIKIMIFVLFGVLLSCSTIPPPKQPDIYPYRIVTITTMISGNISCEDVEKLYSETNEALTPQTGIILFQSTCIRSNREMPFSLFESMKYLTKKFPAPQTDMVIWIDNSNRNKFFKGLLKTLMLPQPQAAIEDTYRRYIVMVGLDSQVLLHEIGHAFIFSHEHSNSGVMMPFQFQLFPGLPALPNKKFSEEDRQEILKNKFRDFSKRVVVKK